MISYFSLTRSPLLAAVAVSAANSPGAAGCLPSVMKNTPGLKLKPSAGGPGGLMGSPSPSTMNTLMATTSGRTRPTPSTPAICSATASGTVARSKSPPISWSTRTVRSAPFAMSWASPANVDRRLSVSVNEPTTNITPMTTTSVVSAKRSFLSIRLRSASLNIVCQLTGAAGA